MLREQIRRIDPPTDLTQLNGGIFDALLNPEGSGVEVARFAKATPTTYDDRGGGVGL